MSINPSTAFALSILLVEDHEDTRGILRRLMERWGYRITSAKSVGEARAALDREEFDVILCDIGLPDGNGTEVAEYLRTKSSIPALAMSGYGTETDKARTRAAGFSRHIVKPILAEDLLQLLRVYDAESPARKAHESLA